VKRTTTKFIGILKKGDWENSAPGFLLGSYYIDLSSTPYPEDNYKELLSTLLGMREKAPPLGTPPVQALREYAKLQNRIDKYNWVNFEFVSLPVMSDSDANRVDLMRKMRNSLIKVYGDSYKSFSIVLKVNSVQNPRDPDHPLTVYSMIGHQRKFIDDCYNRHRQT